MIYLASPYTHENEEIKKERFEIVCSVASYLMLQGIHIFSPIVHTYPIAIRGGVPTSWEFWGDYDKEFLNFCSEMLVLTISGWDKSVGVLAEIEYMNKLRKPILYTLDGKTFSNESPIL
jgi:hypothetical protein